MCQQTRFNLLHVGDLKLVESKQLERLPGEVETNLVGALCYGNLWHLQRYHARDFQFLIT